MFDLIEKRNSPKGKSGGTTNHSDAPITALYERLSCEDELDGESNSVTNQIILEIGSAKHPLFLLFVKEVMNIVHHPGTPGANQRALP